MKKLILLFVILLFVSCTTTSVNKEIEDSTLINNSDNIISGEEGGVGESGLIEKDKYEIPPNG